MRKAKQTFDLQVALLKDETDVSSVLEQQDVKVIECKIGGCNAKMLLRQGSAETVGWWDSICRLTGGGASAVDALGVPVMPLTSQAAGAAILIECDGRWFAILYGTGRFSVGEQNFVERFGLLVTLNSVDPQKLKYMDHKRLSESGRTTQEFVMTPGGTHAFGIDIQQDILSGVAGVPRRRELGNWIAGKDTLALRSAQFSPAGSRFPAKPAQHCKRNAVQGELRLG